jgi:hypothetical protein
MATLMEREATVTIVAYNADGEVLDTLGTFSRLTPSLQLLEFMMDVEVRYPTVVRYECIVAY